MDRQRSRSPHGGAHEETMRLVLMREQARMSKDFATADSIREQLNAAGVTLYDKTRTWKSADGCTGRIPTFSEVEGGGKPESFMPQQQMGQGPPPVADGSESHIKWLVQQREQARAQKDFTSADRFRDELKGLGVEIQDKEKMWRSKSGACGVVIGYRSSGGPTDLEISTLVVQREKARQNNDYAVSDMIRDELRAVGVMIQDKDKTWRSSDGRQGPVPSWTAIQGGGQMPAAAPAMAQANAASLQNQVVQAALQAAQNPNSAMRALQLLRQASGAPPPVPTFKPVHNALPAPPARPTARAPPMPATGPLDPEAGEALELISSCQASGRAPADAEIDWLVGLREKFRQKKDFRSADELRNALRSSLSIELDEKQKTWTSTSDGRSGVIPMWNSIAA